MNDFTKEELEARKEEIPFSEFCKWAIQHQENELMRGRKMYAPPFDLYLAKDRNREK